MLYYFCRMLYVQYSQRSIPEMRRSYLFPGVSLKSLMHFYRVQHTLVHKSTMHAMKSIKFDNFFASLHKNHDSSNQAAWVNSDLCTLQLSPCTTLMA
jgi:hypothetical protein